jgi:PST family polysaccharide transporter
LRPFDASGAFRLAADAHEVRGRAVKGAGATLFSGGISLCLQVVSTVVLARLLTPADFGLVTMVTTFSLLLVNFGGNGFTEAVLQRETVDDLLVSNLFWINVGAGAVFTIAFAGAGSLMARFYGNPLVAQVALGISLSIIVSSTSVLHLALLRRAMCFTAVSANDLIATAVSIGVSIVLAWLGWRYWALVIGVVARPLSQSMGAWYLCRWIPSQPRRVAGTMSMVKFAMHIYGRFSVNYFARNTDNLLVGWRFNAISLGFYKKAYDLFALSGGQLVAPLSNVAVASLSRFAPGSSQYRRYLLSALSLMAFVGMGLGADLTLIGKDVIRFLLGPGWEPAGAIFTYFGPGIGVMLIYATHGWIHLSIGRPDRWFRWGILELVVTALLFLIALPWGPVGMAVAWTVSFWILTLPAFWYAGKPIDLGVGPVISSTWKYLLASLISGAASAAIVPALTVLPEAGSAAGALIRIVVVSTLFATLYLLAVIVLHGGIAPVSRLLKLIREMAPGGKPPRSFATGIPAGDQGQTIPA